MPDLSSALSTLRQPYSFRAFASIPSEVEVLRGTVSASPAEPALTLTYTNISGSHTNVVADMECEIFRGSISIGRVRVATGGATSNTIQVEEVSQGRIQIRAGDTFRVYRSWRLRTRLVGSTASLLRDSRVAVGTNLSSYRPVPIAGGAFAGFVNAASIITVDFSAAASYTIDPNSSGTRTYAWDVRDGTITAGTSTSVSITVTFPPGFRWISLTVTDASNSTSAVQYIPVWAHERTGVNAPREIVINSCTGDRAQGWQLDFELTAGATVNDLPDSSLIVMWQEEVYGGTQSSFGAAIPGRSHIKFVGYLDEETSEASGDEEDTLTRVEFRALSPLAKLSKLVGFSQVVERAGTADSWLKATDLTTRIMMDYIVRFGSTLQVCHDFLNSSTSYDYPAFYLQAATPFEQLSELVDSVDAILTCDRLGRVLIYQDPVISNASARNGFPVTLTLTENEVLSVSGERRHRYRYAQIEGRATTASTTPATSRPLFARAPGLAPADAPEFSVRDRLIVSGQTELQERTGFRYARDNALYDGLPVYENVQVSLSDGFDVFDFLQEWVKLDMPTLYDARGIGWGANLKRYVLQNIAVEYDNESGTKTVTLTMQGETTGVSAAFYQPPADPTTDFNYTDPLLDFPQTEIGFDIPNVDIVTGESPLVVYAVGGLANEIKRMVSFNFQDGTGTVQDMDASLTTTGSPLWAFGDPFQPRRFYVVTTTGLWRTDDRTATSPAWTLVASQTTITGSSGNITPYGEMSINRQGYIALVSGTALCTSYDYGATWQRTNVLGGSPVANNSRTNYAQFAVSPWNNRALTNQGWIYAVYNPGSELQKLYLNTDWGRGTWVEIDSNFQLFAANPSQIIIPYRRLGGVPNKNDAQQQIIVGNNNSGGAPRIASIRKNGTVDFRYNISVDPRPSSNVAFSTRAFNAYTSDGRYIRVLTNTNRIVESENGGVSLNNLSVNQWANNATIHTTTRVGGGNINGWGSNRDLLLTFGTTNGSASWNQGLATGWLYYTSDRGVTWYNLTSAFAFDNGRTIYAELATV